MNQTQRKAISALAVQLQTIHEAIEELRDEEQGKFDNLSEGLQQAEKGQEMEQATSDLCEAAESVEAAISILSEYSN